MQQCHIELAWPSIPCLTRCTASVISGARLLRTFPTAARHACASTRIASVSMFSHSMPSATRKSPISSVGRYTDMGAPTPPAAGRFIRSPPLL